MVKHVVIGAGPAGLSAAWELERLGRRSLVLEADSVVGGISRTVEFRGYRFDIGGHRFFTKVPLVQALWEEILGDDFIERPRLSRIYYNDRFFDYPLRATNALTGLGILESARVIGSYMRARMAPIAQESTFEQWVTNRFGKRLYEIFFKTYTEKVWGMSCSEISADWAAQRIKNLDLLKAVRSAIFGGVAKGEIVSTLIDRFHYPRLGPGMMWERCCDLLQDRGVEVRLDSPVLTLHHSSGRVGELTVRHETAGELTIPVADVISSMPLLELIQGLRPAPPESILRAAAKLRYRDFLTVVLIVDREQVFPDNWIYIHSPEVRVGRIQNFKNWSADMVPDERKTSVGLEYFVNRGDDLWAAADADLIDLATEEMSDLGLLDASEVVDGAVVRMPKAYPVYDHNYTEALVIIQKYLADFENLQVVGRNGQHRYNNQDHSMLAGIFAARNAVRREGYDLWAINVEQEYHEEGQEAAAGISGRLVPQTVRAAPFEDLLRQAFARYDPIALGAAIGIVLGLLIFLATGVLLLRGDEPMGPTLSLLGNYLLGFDVSWTGALIGLVEAGIGGFAIGSGLGYSINRLVGWHERALRRELQMRGLLDPLESSSS